MMKAFIFCFTLFLSGFFVAQKKYTEKEIDSIFESLNNPENFNAIGADKIEKLYRKTQEIGYVKGEVRCLLALADIKAGSLQPAKALDYIDKMKSITLKVKDYEGLIMACNLEAKVFFLDHNYEKAYSILNYSRSFLPKIKNDSKRRNCNVMILIFEWSIYNTAKLPEKTYKDSLLSISKEIFSEGLKIEDSWLRSNRVLNGANYTAKVLISQNKGEEAKFYLDVAEEYVAEKALNGFLVADYYLIKGDYNYANYNIFSNSANSPNYLDLSLQDYKTALKMALEINYGAVEIELYNKIALVYKNKKDLKNENIFLKKAIDKENFVKQKSNIGNSELKKKLYSEEREKERSMSYLFWIAIVLGFLLVFFILVSWKLKIFQKQPIETNDYVLSSLDSNPEGNFNNLSMPALLDHLKSNSDSFYPLFLKEFPDFAEKLLRINPLIKSSDIEFCAMLMFQLDNKQIAQIRNVTVKSVESKKYRIRKKLKLDSDTDMHLWISNL